MSNWLLGLLCPWDDAFRDVKTSTWISLLSIKANVSSVRFRILCLCFMFGGIWQQPCSRVVTQHVEAQSPDRIS